MVKDIFVFYGLGTLNGALALWCLSDGISGVDYIVVPVFLINLIVSANSISKYMNR